ncbi:hypothetical protein MOP88_12110 [Sphingomonas sp. WKB10]|nr:hypothetical protein [Sphingomonas sp. WKB10]
MQTAGAQAMIAMGLQDQAVAMLSTSAGDPAVATATHLFLFETWLDRGDIAKALAEVHAVQGDARGCCSTMSSTDANGSGARQRRSPCCGGARRRAPARLRRGFASRSWRRKRATMPMRWPAGARCGPIPACRRGRSCIERQIVALARATNQLEPIARDLSARLDTGYVASGRDRPACRAAAGAGRPDAAVDAVRRFAARSGTGEVGALNRLAQLYARCATIRSWRRRCAAWLQSIPASATRMSAS